MLLVLDRFLLLGSLLAFSCKIDPFFGDQIWVKANDMAFVEYAPWYNVWIEINGFDSIFFYCFGSILNESLIHNKIKAEPVAVPHWLN